MKVEVEKLIYNQDCNPISVKFKSDKISDKILYRAKVDVLRDCSNKTVVATYTDKLLYVGEVKPDEVNNFLVIRNKKTNKVRLVSYDTVNVELYSKIDDIKVQKKSADDNKAILRNDLAKQFGSKKAKRVTEQREKLKFDIENAKETLQNAVADVNTDEGLLMNHSQSQVDDGEIDYLPSINRNAKTVDEVYDLQNLIPSPVMDGLNADLSTILESDDISELPLSNFCMQNIRILKGNDDIENDDTRCKIYLFINYLLKFLLTPVRNMNKQFIICESSKVVNYYILDNFSALSKAVRRRSSSMKDKLICTILVLAILASSDKQVDLEPLSQDMKLGIKKLQEVSRMLAFSSNGLKKVCLKLPLPAPLSLSKRKKKGM